MKKVFLFTLILSFWIFSAQGAELKIGSIDLGKAVFESDEGKKATKLLEEIINSKQTILLEKDDEIKKLKEDLDRQKKSSSFNVDALNDKEDHLNKLIRDVQIMFTDFQKDVQKKETEFRTGIIKELKEIIHDYAEKEGYAIVFETGESGILYLLEKINITDEIIEKYNESSKAKNKK